MSFVIPRPWRELEVGDAVHVRTADENGMRAPSIVWKITRKQDGWVRLECDGVVRDGKPDPDERVLSRTATYGHPERLAEDRAAKHAERGAARQQGPIVWASDVEGKAGEMRADERAAVAVLSEVLGAQEIGWSNWRR